MIGLAIQEKPPAEKMKEFRLKHKLTYTLLYDEGDKVINKFGFTGIPALVLIDKSGKYAANPEDVNALVPLVAKATK